MNKALTFFAFIFILPFSISVRAMENPFPQELEQDLSAGTTALYMLNFNSAEAHFKRAIEIRPEHPAAYFFLQMLTWYRLTYDSLENRNPALEKLLLEQAEVTFAKAKNFLNRSASVAYLYMGGALGAKGWYHVTRGQVVRAYFAGKKGYHYIQKAIEQDPNLYDAYLGVGMYEYYAATLGPTLKALASFSVRGDKEKALKSLHLAEEKSRYVRLEAAYFLWYRALEENRLEEALEKIELLNRSFPHSPLFRWCEIQTLYAQKKWEEVLKKAQDFIFLANAGPQPENYLNPYKLLLSKVLYHAGLSALNLKNSALAKFYFEKTLEQPAEFVGWKVLSYLKVAEIFELEGKKEEARTMLSSVLLVPEIWNSHKLARQKLKALK